VTHSGLHACSSFLHLVAGVVLSSGLGLAAEPAAAPARRPFPDPLPSWNDGAAKQSIIGYVRRVTDAGSPEHVPEPERIAVFDNDGTLWPEYPIPFQAAFAVDRLRARVAAEPTLGNDPMVKPLLAGDLAPLMAGDRHEGLLHVIGLTHAGLTVEGYQAAVAAWLETAEHPASSGATTTSPTSRSRNCPPSCGPMASRPGSCRAAGPTSCGSGRSGSMASRPSR